MIEDFSLAAALESLLGTGLGVAIAQQSTNYLSRKNYSNRVVRTMKHIIENQFRGVWNLSYLLARLKEKDLVVEQRLQDMDLANIEWLVNSLENDVLYKGEIGEIKHVENRTNEYIVTYHSQFRALVEDTRMHIGELKSSSAHPIKRTQFIEDRISIVLAFGLKAKKEIEALDENDRDFLSKIYIKLKKRKNIAG